MSFLAAWSAPALQSVGEAHRAYVINHRIQQKLVPLCIKLTCMSRIIHVSVGYMYEYSISEKKTFFYKCERHYINFKFYLL